MTVGNTINFLAFRDPKNYRFLPPQFTDQIRDAGKYTAKSESIHAVITGAYHNK